MIFTRALSLSIPGPLVQTLKAQTAAIEKELGGIKQLLLEKTGSLALPTIPNKGYM